MKDNIELNANDTEFMFRPVPTSERRSTFNQIMVWVGFGYVITGLFVGGVLAGFGGKPGMPFDSAVLAVILGVTILTILTTLLGIMAQRTGMSLALISRYSYGSFGANLPLLIMALLTLGWFSSITGMTGAIWGDLFKTNIVVFDPSFIGFTNQQVISLEVFLASIIFGLLFTFTAIKGVKGLEAIAVPISPLILIIAVTVGYLMLKEGGGWQQFLASSQKRTGMSISSGVTVVIGAWIAGAVMGVDLFRFNKNIPAVFFGAFACFVLTNPLLNLVGYLGAISIGQFNYISWMMGFSVLLALFGAIVWTASLWTTNDAELYCNSLYTGPILKSFDMNVSKKKLILFTGIIGTLLGALGFYQLFFADFITVLGVAAPPICGPLLADYYLIRKQKYDISQYNNQPNIKIEGIAAFLTGVVVGFVFQYGIQITFPAALLSLLISTFSYPIYKKLLNH